MEGRDPVKRVALAYPFGEGKRVPTKIRYSEIRLQVAPSCCQTYIMASFKQSQNYNGAGIVLRIVMVFFENSKIVMAQNKLTLHIATAPRLHQTTRRDWQRGEGS